MDNTNFDFTQVSLFTNRVFERSRKLIDVGIWQGIDKHRLDGWIEGLAVHDELDLLAACLLDNLIYRSRDQVNALIRNLFYSHMGITMPDLREDLISLLRKKNSGSVVVTPIIALHQPPTKSGPYILRIAQRLFRFHDSNLRWPFDLGSITSKTKFLLCIDDFCGTGGTFEKFFIKNKIDEIHSSYPEMRIIYMVTAAHSDGIDYINNKFPFIEVCCSDRLSERHDFFKDSMFEKYGTDGLREYVTQRYEDFTIKNGVAVPESTFYRGYGQLGLTYAAFHSTPNNSLPVFWSNNGSWTPLLDR